MVAIVETPVWETEVYQLETDDPVLGGVDGIDNLQAKQLGNRTQYLKQQVEGHLAETTDAHDASAISNVPSGNLAANNVQAALNELQTDVDTRILTASKDATGGVVGMTLFKINFRNALNTFTSFFTNSNTAARTYTFQDRDGTIADNTDLALKAPLASPALTDNPTAPTPAQFDDDTSLATTAFVQRALGNLQGEQAYNTSQAITGPQVGKIINFSGAGVTLTLPNSANVPVGSMLTFYGNGFGGIVQKAAGDLLLNGTSGSISSFNLVAHDKAVLVSIGSAGWYVIGGEVGLRSSSSLAASLAASGYQKLPSGLIIQWGNITNSVTPSNPTAVTFPIAFPSAVRQLVVASNTNLTTVSAVWYDSQTASGFNMRSNNGSTNASYIAIGN